jgi:fido (protein-threonine AMPylation protein)/transcriptional regulator with XRE-family HTH domain
MFGNQIRALRVEKGRGIKDIAQAIHVDPSLLSRIEREERKATEAQVQDLARIFEVEPGKLMKDWLSDKVFDVIHDYPLLAREVLEAMESRIAYLSGPHRLQSQAVSPALAKKLARIDSLQLQWATKKPKKGIQLTKLNESFGVEYTYESNKIEGNTLSLQETYLVIHDGLTIAGKSIQEHLEAINHDEAIDFIRELVESKLPLTEYRLKQIHHLVLKGIDRKNAGVYRSVPVRIGGSSHVPPEPFEVPRLMEELFAFYEVEKKRMHPVLLAAEMHERLVTIHPFIDGNGRTARLLMNLILLRNGYTIAILKGNKTSRMNYYKALEAVQVDADTTPFFNLIVQHVEESLVEHLKYV